MVLYVNLNSGLCPSTVLHDEHTEFSRY
ncbi:hypothetical protein F383_09238 [Gossypium arboreum]|uniref:Uncharacterized protein n=1 Tax=Gossypium arboreum TaxID=29729 RepID=A0A0B0PKA8_GOSAR|nr:hypothetical protein F383_09238 [Gossypium arboreum]